MKKIVWLVGVVVLSGCAAQVMGSGERSVIVWAGSTNGVDAQVLADVECKKRGLFARFNSKMTPNQFAFDCVN